MSETNQEQIMFDSPSTELASHRTSLAVERTVMAADRTLMATLRTSLALIGFGFTIVKFFHDWGKASGMSDVLHTPARNFGLSLIGLGVVLLVAGLLNHWQVFVALRIRREQLHAKGLLGRSAQHKTSPTALICLLLLLIGLLVILGVLVRTGPYG